MTKQDQRPCRICALAMLLDTVADRTGRDAYRKAAARIDAAVRQVTPKLKSLSAGQMGYSTTEVGDLVVEAL